MLSGRSRLGSFSYTTRKAFVGAACAIVVFTVLNHYSRWGLFGTWSFWLIPASFAAAFAIVAYLGPTAQQTREDWEARKRKQRAETASSVEEFRLGNFAFATRLLMVRGTYALLALSLVGYFSGWTPFGSDGSWWVVAASALLLFVLRYLGPTDRMWAEQVSKKPRVPKKDMREDDDFRLGNFSFATRRIFLGSACAAVAFTVLNDHMMWGVFGRDSRLPILVAFALLYLVMMYLGPTMQQLIDRRGIGEKSHDDKKSGDGQ